MLLITRFIITLLVALLISHHLSGFFVHNIYETLLFGVVLSFVNAILRPILLFLTLPITILTLGLFTLVINVFTFWIASLLSYGVYVETFKAAICGGLIMWLTGFFTNRFVWNTEMY